MICTYAQKQLAHVAYPTSQLHELARIAEFQASSTVKTEAEDSARRLVHRYFFYRWVWIKIG